MKTFRFLFLETFQLVQKDFKKILKIKIFKFFQFFKKNLMIKNFSNFFQIFENLFFFQKINLLVNFQTFLKFQFFLLDLNLLLLFTNPSQSLLNLPLNIFDGFQLKLIFLIFLIFFEQFFFLEIFLKFFYLLFQKV